ncbi:hypothetical protein T484DRAFT_1827415 [Baffinella frigidus]|nr:hypothetical protein T484DRAFT_1827415 [Cryptophyta sp. CCMP2293]
MQWLSSFGLICLATSWGLCCVARALKFLNDDCKLVHGNLCRSSVVVSDSGDWKLGGFELVADGSDPSSLLRRCAHLRAARVMPPEVAKGQWQYLADANHSLDTWRIQSGTH